MTLTQYLTGLRVKYAAKLLGGGGTGQQRVSDIALRAGFLRYALLFTRI